MKEKEHLLALRDFVYAWAIHSGETFIRGRVGYVVIKRKMIEKLVEGLRELSVGEMRREV